MQGILSTAQIEAAQEAISKAPSDADAAGNAHVGQRHLLAGLATAQRSLPAAELQRLQAIYARFRCPDAPSVICILDSMRVAAFHGCKCLALPAVKHGRVLPWCQRWWGPGRCSLRGRILAHFSDQCVGSGQSAGVFL